MAERTTLRKWRIAKGMSRRALAAELHTSVPSICDWENGKKNPSLRFALAIEKLTGGTVPAISWVTRRAA